MGLLDWLFVRLGTPRPPSRLGALLRRATGLRTAPGDRRRIARLPGFGARVILNGRAYEVADWSDTSFRLTGHDGNLTAREVVEFRFRLVHRGETWEWPGTGRVVRVAENGDVAIIYRTPPEPFRSQLHDVIAAMRAGERTTDRDRKRDRVTDRPDTGEGGS